MYIRRHLRRKVSKIKMEKNPKVTDSSSCVRNQGPKDATLDPQYRRALIASTRGVHTGVVAYKQIEAILLINTS